MIAFEVKGGARAADSVISRMQLMTPATSLGGVETLIERRAKWEGEEALPPGLVRLSVGIEAMEDLWFDLDQALSAVVA
jgi:cystathionine gamma-synthase